MVHVDWLRLRGCFDVVQCCTVLSGMLVNVWLRNGGEDGRKL